MVGWRFVVTFVPLFAAANYWLFLAPIGPGANRVYDFSLLLSMWFCAFLFAYLIDRRLSPPNVTEPHSRRA